MTCALLSTAPSRRSVSTLADSSRDQLQLVRVVLARALRPARRARVLVALELLGERVDRELRSCCTCSCSMRRSANICCCSRLCALAPAGSASAVTATRTIDRIWSCVCRDARRPSPHHDDRTGRRYCFDVTMKCARRFLFQDASVVARIERKLLAVADGPMRSAGDAEREQVVLGGQRAPIAQRQIVFGRAAFVAVAFDRDDPGAYVLSTLGVLGRASAAPRRRARRCRRRRTRASAASWC